MIVMTDQVKLLVLSFAMLPGPVGQSGAQDRIPTEDIPCISTEALRVDTKAYREKTRAQLTALGRAGDPVGLYYVAHRDLEAGRTQEAQRKLEQAAAAGLSDAYVKLAELHARRRDPEAARKAEYCAEIMRRRLKVTR